MLGSARKTGPSAVTSQTPKRRRQAATDTAPAQPERQNAMHLATIKLDHLAELVRLLPFVLALLFFLTGQGRRGKRRTGRPTARPTSAPPSPTSKPAADQSPPATKDAEPSIWAKDDSKEDQWGLPKEEWGDGFGGKWKSAFDDPAPPKKR